MLVRVIAPALAALAPLLVLVAAGSDRGSTRSAGILAGAATSVACAAPPAPRGAEGCFGPEGGTLEDEDAASPVAGTVVAIPAGALAERETIRIGHEEVLPAPLAAGVVRLSEVLVLTKTSSRGFAKPVTVTVPARVAALGEREVPAVIYWNPERRSWSSVTLTGVDRARGRVQFRTAHFTEFVVVYIPGLLPPIVVRNPFYSPSADDVKKRVVGLTVDTGFDPRKDGIAYANAGHTQANGEGNGGDCAGMSELAALWFVEHQRLGLPPLRTAYPGDTPRLHDIEQVGQDQQKGISMHALGSDRGLATGLELVEHLQATHEPQLLAINFPDGEGGLAGHEVVVVGYKDGHFLIYDPNFPDELTQLDYGPDGFGGFRHADGRPLGGFYDHVTSIGSTTLSDIGGEDELTRLMEAPDKGQAPHPNDITVQSTKEQDGRQTITGQVAGYDPARPVNVVVRANGRDLRVPVSVDGNGHFEVTVSSSDLLRAGVHPGTTVDIQVIARAPDGSYAGGSSAEPFAVTTPPPPSETDGFAHALDLSGGASKLRDRRATRAR